jgi:hypothetical protein
MKVKKTSITVLASLMFIFFIQTQSFSQGTDSNERWLAPESAKEISNPVESNKSSIKKGAAIFKTRCTVCHGNEGHGDGPDGKDVNTGTAPYKYPIGTVVVKESYKNQKAFDAKKTPELTIMVKLKAGESPETGDWGFVKRKSMLVIT